MFTTLVNARKLFHPGRPVVHHKTDVPRKTQSHRAQPFRHMRVERDERIGRLFFHPVQKRIAAEAQIVARKKQERHPVLHGQAVLPVKQTAAVPELRPVHDPLRHSNPNPPVTARGKLFGCHLDAQSHVPRAHVQRGFLHCVSKRHGGERRIVHLRTGELHALR